MLYKLGSIGILVFLKSIVVLDPPFSAVKPSWDANKMSVSFLSPVFESVYYTYSSVVREFA
jgi:hypothetical protein